MPINQVLTDKRQVLIFIRHALIYKCHALTHSLESLLLLLCCCMAEAWYSKEYDYFCDFVLLWLCIQKNLLFLRSISIHIQEVKH